MCLFQPSSAERAESSADFPAADATAARMGRTLERRALGLKERLVGLVALWEASGWCVVAFPGPDRLPLVGEAAAAWLEAHAPLADPSVLTSRELAEMIPASKVSISSSTLLVWDGGTGSVAADKIRSLTQREQEVLAWLQKGKTVPETAIILGCATRTVEKHAQNLYRKLGIKDRATLILMHPQ